MDVSILRVFDKIKRSGHPLPSTFLFHLVRAFDFGDCLSTVEYLDLH